MRRFAIASVLLLLCWMPLGHAAETSVAGSTNEGIELMELLHMSAERLKKRFIVDPRVRGQVLLVNVDPRRMSYRELQAVLSVHGLVTTPEIEGTIRIVPDANARQLPMPLVHEKADNIGEEEMVTRIIDVESLEAARLIPILRPLLPQYAHLVADGQTNSLIVVARQGNVRMMESIIRDLRARPTVETRAESK